MKTAELYPAFEWVCDECGWLNYASGVTLSVEQVEHMVDPIKRIDVGADTEGVWMVKPDKVTCKRCCEEFETVEMPYGNDSE